MNNKIPQNAPKRHLPIILTVTAQYIKSSHWVILKSLNCLGIWITTGKLEILVGKKPILYKWEMIDNKSFCWRETNIKIKIYCWYFLFHFLIISNLSSSQIKTGFLHVCEVHTEKPCVWGVNKNNQELVVIKSTIQNHSKLLVHINYLQIFAYIKTWKTLNNIPFVQTMVKPRDLFYFTNSYSLRSSPFNSILS